MALPVIASAGGKQWVECLLPVNEGVRRDNIDDGSSNCPKSGSIPLCRLHIAGMAHGEDQHLLAMPFRGQEWQRRGLPHHCPASQFVRRQFEGLTVSLENAHRVFERMHDEPRQNLRPELVKLEFERGNGAEVPAAAAKRPEQVWIFRSACVLQLTIGCHDIGRQEVVYRQAELPRNPAETAAQR